MHYPPARDNPLRTRVDVQDLVGGLLDPLGAHFTAGGAGLKLGATLALYGEPAGLLEAFSRPLWGLAPLLAGGGCCRHFPRWSEGLANGSNPDHAEFWGWAEDFDQRIVEMPAIALSLVWLPRDLWAAQPESVRQRVARWLGHINEVQPVDNNWRFFRVLTNAALRRLGADWSADNLANDLARLDQFYLGDGWYADGEGRRGDYYVPMAMHYYGLLYAQVAGDDDPSRAAIYRARAQAFAADFAHWFDADGAAVPFGRSLAYRFAQGAFWGALAWSGVEALPWGVIKGLYLRHLRWWMRRPIFSESGLLTVGYAYPNPGMGEPYNAPGSPYWAFKAFLPLALAETHPFWTAPEAPLPAPRHSVLTVPAAGLVVCASPGSRHVVAINAGQPVTDYPRHAAQKYSKFAYSTAFAFSVATGSARLPEGGFDSVLAVSDDNVFFRARETCLGVTVADGVAHSRWQPWPDVEIDTWLIAEPTMHVRVHRVRTKRRLWLSEGGFAIGYLKRSELAVHAAADNIVVQTPLGGSGLRDLHGNRRGEQVVLDPGSNLVSPLSAMPVLRSEHAPGVFWLACVAGGWLEGEEPFAAGSRAYSFVAEGTRPVLLCANSVRWKADTDGG